MTLGLVLEALVLGANALNYVPELALAQRCRSRADCYCRFAFRARKIATRAPNKLHRLAVRQPCASQQQTKPYTTLFPAPLSLLRTCHGRKTNKCPLPPILKHLRDTSLRNNARHNPCLSERTHMRRSFLTRRATRATLVE
eukprot:4407819-Pleurochrysis_carterae.AAC.1